MRPSPAQLSHELVPEIVTLGEPLIQLTPHAKIRLPDAVELEIHTGGAEANVAVAMARLGHRVAYVGRVGADPFGERILGELRSAGVDTSAIARDSERPTGIYIKDHDGARSTMHYYRRGSAATQLSFEDLRPLLTGNRLVHTTGVTAALSNQCLSVVRKLARHARDVGEALLSFDVNYRPALWDRVKAAPVLLDLARSADIVFVGCDEAEALWGAAHPEAIRSLMPRVPQLVVKDSAAAAHSFVENSVVTVPALPTVVVEPVGAGDAFAAGFLSGHLHGKDRRAALRYGHLLASAALASVADQVAPPDAAALAAAAAVDDQSWSRGRPVLPSAREVSHPPTAPGTHVFARRGNR